MNKICTSIEQSQKLIELGVDINTADMFYADLLVDDNHKYNLHPLESYGFKTFEETKLRTSEHLDFIPAWSLTALLKLMPKSIISTPNPFSDNYCCRNVEFDMEFYTDNAVDAAFEMMVWLKENKKL